MNGNGFTGMFQGLGNTISNLTIAPTGQNLNTIGLFGSIGVGGVVENLRLTNADYHGQSELRRFRASSSACWPARMRA